MAEQNEQTTEVTTTAPTTATAEPSHSELHASFKDEIRGKTPAATEKVKPSEPVVATPEEPGADKKQEKPVEQKRNKGDERFGKLKRESETTIAKLNARIKALESSVKPRDQYDSDAAHAAAVASVETAKQMASSEIAENQAVINDADNAFYAERVASVPDRQKFENNLKRFGQWIDANDPITHDFAMTHENGFQVLDFVMEQFAVPGMLEQWAQKSLVQRAKLLDQLAARFAPQSEQPNQQAPAAPTAAPLARSIAPESGSGVSAPTSDLNALHKQYRKQYLSR